MDSHQFLRTRRSVRRYTTQAVSLTVIERILSTAGLAPSAHNRQPWRFAVVMQPQAKTDLSAAMAEAYRQDLQDGTRSIVEVTRLIEKSRMRLETAPAVIVLCMDMSEMDRYPEPRRNNAERIMAIQSTANACMQLLLAAHAEGLGAAWNCAPLFAPGPVLDALDLPAAWEPQGMVTLGFPAEQPEAKLRKPLGQIAVFR
jgi:coenzyme F420-0:L-glutamate ligase/coenzyme F420-1:gamma-L-glutamate ligase